MFLQNRHASPRPRSHLSRLGVRLPLLTVLSAILVVCTAGCGSDSTPTGVELSDSLIPQVSASIGSRWDILASVTVEPGGDAVVLAGSRYSLAIPPGAVSQPLVITLSEAADGDLLFEFSPVGLVLDEDALLRIDYSGTRLDPDSPDYDFSTPQLVVVNGQNVAIEQIEGVDQQRARLFVAPLGQLSRLQLIGVHCGTAGWD